MQIKNGIVTELDGIGLIQHLIPVSNELARPQYPMVPKYITIHNTGNPGASALANSKYVDVVNSYVSWHFTVGPGEVYQELPITESAWHAGDGENGTGNRKSIGIEIAEVDGAEETAIQFLAQLTEATGIGVDKVVPHQYWSGKYCPRLILPHWAEFIANIKKELERDDMSKALVLQEDWHWTMLLENIKLYKSKGFISGDEWEKKVKDKSITVDELAWLNNEIISRIVEGTRV